ncbi:MAG: septal ring lytic transglycosylase RlpA family protein [Rhodospirillales bacterium]|nr:septal ring lytic transglycosylase RlpA family protein [Rhodospirillales bacterium]
MIRKIVKASVDRRLALVLIGSLFLLGACSETKLLFYTAKRINKQSESGVSGYKIGNPYQVKGVWYYPAVDYRYDKSGIGSWYGPGFHGKKTANGEIYNQNALTAAHKTLPLPSAVQVTNLENGRSIRLTVNDRGPFVNGRIIDVSRRAAQLLGFHGSGTARVRVRALADVSRALAARARGGAVVALAQADSPIQTDVNVSKPMVSSEILEPPRGARPARAQSENYGPNGNRPDAREAQKASSAEEEVVTVEQVSPTDVYVQAGAFKLYENAHRLRVRLFKVRAIKISSVIVDGAEYFRVRAGPIRDIKIADKILERVIDAGVTGARIVVDRRLAPPSQS